MCLIGRHAFLQEIEMSTCNGQEVSCLLVAQDDNKLMWKYEDKRIF
jgi:hypothetical protein